MRLWVKRGFTPLLYQPPGTLMNHRKAEIVYHTFVYVRVRVCMCARVCLLALAAWRCRSANGHICNVYSHVIKR